MNVLSNEIAEPVQEPAIRINPNLRLQVLRVGHEETPVIIADDFVVDASQLRQHACNLARFRVDDTSAYPGVRAKLPKSYVIATLNALFRIVCQIYGIPAQLDLKPQNAVYSLVATPPERLSLSQQVPHFDSNRAYFYAITHYLNAGPFGGTGLFRHRPTGFENILEHRLGEYLRAGEAFIARHGPPPPRYVTASDAHYELFHSIEYRPNRLICYPGSLLHSGLIDPGRDLGDDPGSGRLTANIFIDFR